MQFHPLFTDDYLFANWGDEFDEYVEAHDAAVLELLTRWSDRDTNQSETQLHGPFVSNFFETLWGFVATGAQLSETEYTLRHEYPVPGAGEKGGTGKADLGLGYFERNDAPDIPQVLCEFKDINSALDLKQNRKGNSRTPVRQCIDYLKHAFDKLRSIESTVDPTWGIVTDMNEFRLYYRKLGDGQFLKFVVAATGTDDDQVVSLIASTIEGQRKRFLFWKVFQCDSLIARHGRSELQKILESQVVHEKKLEKSFYLEYKDYRQFVYDTIVESNPKFPGSKKELVRLTQRLLDRCIFLLFCEDMGKTLSFPVNLVKDILREASLSKFYSESGVDVWARIKSLFDAMRDGGQFPPHTISKFNGGLFENNTQLEQLEIPNRVFCTNGQGETPGTISEFKDTLLYLSTYYNFGAEGTSGSKTITLYTLGRIFEQSITELEYMEAEAEAYEAAVEEGKTGQALQKAVNSAQSLAKLNKRKRTGVYYTPEWVTGYIVREVIGTRLDDERKKLGLELGREFTKNQFSVYQKNIGTKEVRTNEVFKHTEKLDRYQEFLDNIRVLDPACGSGAFLIQALQFLLTQHAAIADERRRVTGAKSVLEQDAIIRDILGKNLYGVDISPESVEIAQLALWLNTARKDQPLSNLDHHIREGNSLVGPEFNSFYADTRGSLFDSLDTDAREKINVFDWNTAFPEVLGVDIDAETRGFDCVIGNPPYVKIENFARLHEDESDFFQSFRSDGTRIYESTATGKYDLFCPFIEKSLELLSSSGRMGFIAPSVWLKNKYGEALRALMQNSHSMDRWIDFRAFQVFDEATTYTAIQMFHKSKDDTELQYIICEDGEVTALDWDNCNRIDISQLEPDAGWHLRDEQVQVLFDRLEQECDQRFADIVDGFFVGIQTSKNDVYHFRVDTDGSLLPWGNPDEPVDLEKDHIHILVKGPDTKRYLLPLPNTRILIPYELKGDSHHVLSEAELSELKGTWNYLQSHEETLRRRDNGSLDKDDGWWGFNYEKNLDKQHLPRVLIAGTAEGLRCFGDFEGKFVQDDRRVYAAIPKDAQPLGYLLGLLNSKLMDFLFRHTARPKANGFYDIEEQFLEVLPVPLPSDADMSSISTLALELQAKHSARKELVNELSERINSLQSVDMSFDESWLWGDVKPTKVLKADAPQSITGARERTAWAKKEREARLSQHLEKLDAHIHKGIPITAKSEKDALFLKCGEVTIIAKFGLEINDCKYFATLWRQILRETNISEKFTAETLVKLLLNVRSSDDVGLREAIFKYDGQVESLDLEISRSEEEMDKLIYSLYCLTDEEVQLVESR